MKKRRTTTKLPSGSTSFPKDKKSDGGSYYLRLRFSSRVFRPQTPCEFGYRPIGTNWKKLVCSFVR